MKTRLFKMNRSDLINQLSVGLVLMTLFAIQLPEGGTLLLLPALLLVYFQRAVFHIEPELKRIGGLFIAYVVIFAVVSTDPSRSAKGAYDIVRGLLVFFPAVWLGVQLARVQERSFAVFIGLLFILANLAFPHVIGEQVFYGYHDNPNNVAVALTAHLFLLAALYPQRLAGPRFWHVLAFVAALCAALLLLVLANSRGSWLGVAVAFSLITMLQPAIPRRIKLALILAAGAGLLALVTLADMKGFGYGTVGARIEIWTGLWKLTVTDHLWLGYGINYVKDVLMASGLPTLTAHNVFLELFVSTGLIGLTTFLYIVYRLVAFLLRQNYTRGAVLYAGVGGLAAFLVMGLFDLKFASFKFIAMTSCFLGLIYSQRVQSGINRQTRQMAPELG